MQLKEEFRSYEALRREHDSQIIQIAMESGLRIAPDQWSSLLYGDTNHKSHMQSIIDKVRKLLVHMGPISNWKILFCAVFELWDFIWNWILYYIILVSYHFTKLKLRFWHNIYLYNDGGLKEVMPCYNECCYLWLPMFFTVFDVCINFFNTGFQLQTPQSFTQSTNELVVALQRSGDPCNLQRLRPHLEFLASIDPSPGKSKPCTKVYSFFFRNMVFFSNYLLDNLSHHCFKWCMKIFKAILADINETIWR